MTSPTQTFAFQAEIRQLLDIVVHAIYTEKEIFVRELVSNASDALERLRQLQLTEKGIRDETLPLEITVTSDPTAKTLTIQDSGVGMTREELVENLGTIAHSGSKAFLAGLPDEQRKAAGLIGQFGVGFYSVFMVAKRVRVHSQSWRLDAPALVWTSDGVSGYEIAEGEPSPRGTTVVVELKDDCGDYASDWRLRDVLGRYSAFLPFPLILNGDRINTVGALWRRNRNEITDQEYAEFYRFQSHAQDDPRMRLHFSFDAPLSLNAVLFVPKINEEKLGLHRGEPSVALYSRRVLIDARPTDLLPTWLRFLKGVVDSEDLPLNLSRESVQERALIARVKSALVVRVLRFFEDRATQAPDEYADFYQEFGQCFKEGIALDFTYRDQLAKLLRFESSATEPGRRTSLADYVSRMAEGQDAVYYILGASRASIESGPYVEGFKARKMEVLYCYEAPDEYVMNALHTFEGKRLLAADHADVALTHTATAENGLAEEEARSLAAWLRETLGERVTDVVPSARLVDSPVLAINADRSISPFMRRTMRAMNRKGGDAPVRVKLEINPAHPVITRLASTRASDASTASLVAEQLLDNALLSAGLLDDPSLMVGRLNKLLERV